jgi:hypothetical protein
MPKPHSPAAHIARGSSCGPDQEDGQTDEFLTVSEAAHFLRCSKSFLDKSRLTGEGPPYFRIGRKVLYGRRALQRWIVERQYRSTSEYRD